jgi:hypothetical protein
LVGCLVVVAAVVMLLVGIPGGGGGAGGPLSPVAQAAERTASVGGARFSGTGTGSFSGASIQMTFDGEFNGQADRSRIEMQVQASGGQPVMTTMTGVMDGSVMYMSTPLFAGQLPDGAEWMRLDLADFGSEREPAAGMDARQMLQELRAVAPGARAVGAGRVRGAKTTHWTATIDPALQAQELRDAGNDAAADLIEQGGAPSVVEVWIDNKDLIRRMKAKVPFALPGQPAQQLTMSFEIYDFGATPAIEVPAEQDVFDATALSQQALEAATG